MPGKLNRCNRTILVVENQLLSYMFFRDRLELDGCATREGEAEPLPTWGAHRGPIRLLASDIMAAGLNDGELARRLGVLYLDLKLIHISGETADELVRIKIVDPGKARLPAPITPSELLGMVQGQL